MKKMFLSLGTLIANKMFGKPYEIEVTTGESILGPIAAGVAPIIARPIKKIRIRRLPYTMFGHVVSEVSWGTLVIGQWPHPHQPKNGHFPTYYAAYVRPQHVIKCSGPFLVRVPGYREWLANNEVRLTPYNMRPEIA